MTKTKKNIKHKVSRNTKSKISRKQINKKLNKIKNGGNPAIKLTSDNTDIIQITNNNALENYKEKLIDLTNVCEPTDVFEPSIKEGYEIFWLVKYLETGEIAGYLKSTNLTPYQNDDNFELLGGIKGQNGLQISGACNGMPTKYSNLATLLLEEIKKYARANQFNYILLHAGTDRDYLISNGERKGLYIKNGFKKIRILKAGEGGFADIDLWIMHKEIQFN
jgi:hypothetical protein